MANILTNKISFKPYFFPSKKINFIPIIMSRTHCQNLIIVLLQYTVYTVNFTTNINHTVFIRDKLPPSFGRDQLTFGPFYMQRKSHMKPLSGQN